MVLACGSTIYPVKPARAQASRPLAEHGRGERRVLRLRAHGPTSFSFTLHISYPAPEAPSGIGGPPLPRIGSVPPDESLITVCQLIRSSAAAERRIIVVSKQQAETARHVGPDLR